MEWLMALTGPLSLAAGVLLWLFLLAMLLFVAAKLEGYDAVRELFQRDNPALGLRYALFVIAVIFALLGIFDGAQGDSGFISLAQHAALAAALIYLSRFLNDWFILYGFSNNREVVQEKNMAVAIVEGATYLASAYIIAGAFYDWQNGLWFAVEWFLIGQLLLIVLGLLYRGLSPHVFAALDKHNVAVAISLGGFLLSGGIVCGAVISGPSKGWQQDILAVAIYTACWLALILIAHLASDLLALRSSRVREEVTEQRNIAPALFKAVIFISVSLGYIHG